ncbi:MAG TPA: glucose-6-phosphate dehydrogenase assembly protein OpcA [Rubrobacteraceae bacterium]|nr:glucose-6-phosphate dehydrogenase assembly protein OpcA [Rubrobacteraceae bacterium]
MAAAVIGETRSSPDGRRMSVEEIEHELARLRMNEDGTLALRASVLNLIVVTDEDSAQSVTRSVSDIAGRYPSRAIVLISDPEEAEKNLELQLSAFCSVRGESSTHVCAEQITIHAEGPPAEHLESLAGPLLIPDLRVFLWYPGPFSPTSPEFAGMVTLADRIILDSAAADDCELSLKEIAELLDDPETPAVGDLQWVQLTPWRSLVAQIFDPPERAGELERLRGIEILHAPDGECRALLFVGWLASSLGWNLEGSTRTENGREVRFSGPSGEITAEMSTASPDARFRQVRLYSDDYGFEVARSRDLSEARTVVTRGSEVLGERTVHLGHFDLGVLLGEELSFRGRDGIYENALRAAVEILEP